jgi:serine/threonine protein kinase
MVWYMAMVLNAVSDIFSRMFICFLPFVYDLVCGKGLKCDLRLIELCCYSHKVLHRDLKLEDLMID